MKLKNKSKKFASMLAMMLAISTSSLSASANETLKLDDGSWHVKARSQENKLYTQRYAVPDQYVDWNVAYAGYAATPFESPNLAANVFTNVPNANKTNIWADGPDPAYANRKWAVAKNDPNYPFSFNYQVEVYDRDGKGIMYPKNPFGRTGMTGRGLLGQWGANYAADPLYFRYNPNDGNLEILIVLRGDVLQLAFPGGMVEYGDTVSFTLKKEMKEETGLDINFISDTLIYKGYVDDPRNTDNAWMETSAYVDMAPEDVASKAKPVGGDDAVSAGFRVASDELIKSLYGSHSLILEKARQIFVVFEGPRRVAAMTNAAANFGEVNHQNLMNYASAAHKNIKSGSAGLTPIVNINYGTLKSSGSSVANSRGLKLNNDFMQLNLGAEYTFSDNLAVGAVFYLGQLNGKFGLPKADSLSQAGKSTISDIGINLFATTAVRECGFMHFTGGGSKLGYEVKRDVKFTSNSLSFKGKADGYRYHAGITTGMNMDVAEVNLEPSVGLTYNRVTLEDYHEDHRLNQNAKLSMNRNSLKARVGGKISKGFEFAADQTLTPYFKASYAHELISQSKYVKGQVTSKKIETQYAVDQLQKKGLVLLEVGTSYNFSKFTDIALAAQTSLGSKYADLKQLNLKLNIKF